MRRSAPAAALVLAALAPAPAQAVDAQGAGGAWTIAPFATVVGGVAYETVRHTTGGAVNDTREDRPLTLGLSRFGLRGGLPDGWSIETEFEANAGNSGHGPGGWEGQAALQVRNQLIRFVDEDLGLRLDAGRIQDDASVDFFSRHVADLLMTDPLAGGLNRGNGLYGTWTFLPGLSAGLTLNAANPTSNTGILAVGGSYQPFERFFDVAVKDLGQDPNHFPRDSMHFTIVSPSVIYEGRVIQAKAGAQWFSVNHNTETSDVDTIDGLNLRAGVRARLLNNLLVPFVNATTIRNNVVNPRDNGRTVPGQDWRGSTVSGGLDLNLLGDSGVGGEYAPVTGQEGDRGTLRQVHFINVGASWHLDDATVLAARMGMFRKVDEEAGGAGQDASTLTSGKRSWFLTLRTSL